MRNKRVIQGLGISAFLALSLSSFYLFQNSKDQPGRSLNDEALLSIIKNDQRTFEKFLASGGRLDYYIEVEGKSYTIGELLVKYERVNFIKFASDQKLAFHTDLLADSDMWTLAVSKNNPDLLKALMASHPDYKLNSKKYGPQDRSLLHLASIQCSNKVVGILHQNGMSWSDKDNTGATPLTLAADNDCLNILSYWKEQGADFKVKDGRGMSALSILSKKKDAALMAFTQSFMENRSPASVAIAAAAPQVPNFYKKRVIPKDNLADRAHLIEPEARPDEANETDDNSEFSD